ncbi:MULTISPECIES: MotA/TolQ/ExbB proton channel family protein [Stenotrophomonas]|jgi:biopolymer transport protein ExbB/TolQ|uniref:MotA/TolQ/ExbB proton channel family protein n=1 Tax=Stenotrophomonas TaxID=40323 RepID=UPI000702B335|nr:MULTISPECIES: MotA/TolQ/ExbB proton channel family protein [Stenotrophomonas]ODU47088.1 MAG: hypothetical protein ABS96_06715 [Xanthomonadaceae bacterium SCN 69-123]OJY72874.1 MAG: hypothetical protein BGP18_08910 [Stenotrophomonas sp. 69-14]OZB52069.1 MAG: hypothetical protein B7X38_10435 [Stenotrophomonas sp. 14-69-23]KRG84398.1 hypothetical protein ABB33_11530 [Stenotrophomonas acidaminiphila]MBN8800600.1 MotA/TolQ/ExbB proton channel family protein [Stenotrophomonas acidaminiphila]
MNLIESLLHQLSGWFLAPVLLLILALFLYACYALGMFAVEAVQRRGDRMHAMERHWRRNGGGLEDMELWTLKRLEPLRIGSRTAPMLGLVATMIPMGPALAGLSDGRMDEVARHVGVAFAAVIVSLLAASAIYTVLVVRRRWLLQDLRRIELAIAGAEG